MGRGDLRINGLSTTSVNTNLPNQLDYSSVDEVYRLLKSDFDGALNQNQLIDGAKAGLVAATGDPYTQYFNPQQASDFKDQLAGEFSGIGAELGSDDSGSVIIVSPIAGYPAAKTGLKPKDIIAAVDGQSTSGMSIDAVVGKIRGPAGSKVVLTIVRGNGQPFDVSIAREKIIVPSVSWHVDGAIGYMKIGQFSTDTASLAAQAAQEFKAKGVKGLVLDLRGNPGGYLASAVEVSSLWLDPGKTVVSERRGNTIISTEQASGKHPFKGLPTVVLIDGGSASASEITAGALRDNGAATLVGQKSFGKGSVQQVENLPDGSEVKITTARWYTPAGKNIDKQGITADVSIGITDTQAKAGQDPQLDKAKQILLSKI